jgi:NADPH-dependent glutamate synthase beta subunit-like oxidoreductase
MAYSRIINVVKTTIIVIGGQDTPIDCGSELVVNKKIGSAEFEDVLSVTAERGSRQAEKKIRLQLVKNPPIGCSRSVVKLIYDNVIEYPWFEIPKP